MWGTAIIPATADGARTFSITDMAGRKVSIPAQVKRIVPLGGAMRFVVYMQGLDAVVGVEAIEQKKTSDSAGRPYSLAVADRAAALPAIGEGGPGRLPDFERIMAVAPDLILAVGVDNAQVETIQQKTGVPVVVVHPGATADLNLDQVRESFRLLGRVIHREERARQLIDFLGAAKVICRHGWIRCGNAPWSMWGASALRGGTASPAPNRATRRLPG